MAGSAAIPGPSPTPASPATLPETESISWNRSLAALKKFTSSELRPAKGPPAPDGPPRTPGSCWANAVPARSSIPTAMDKTDASLAVFIQSLLIRRLKLLEPPWVTEFPREFLSAQPKQNESRKPAIKVLGRIRRISTLPSFANRVLPKPREDGEHYFSTKGKSMKN